MMCMAVAMVIMPMAIAMVVLMSVVPQFGLVEQKEEQKPQQQSEKQRMGTRFTFKSFRQQM